RCSSLANGSGLFDDGRARFFRLSSRWMGTSRGSASPGGGDFMSRSGGDLSNLTAGVTVAVAGAAELAAEIDAVRELGFVHPRPGTIAAATTADETSRRTDTNRDMEARMPSPPSGWAR